jgi:hypothetical protein
VPRPPETHRANAFPVILRSTDARVEKDEAQDIALFRRQRSIVGQHDSRRPVPGDNVPCRGPEDGWAWRQNTSSRHRRIPDKQTLTNEIAAWETNRNAHQADWQFTTENARIKLKRLYPQFE